MTALSAAVDRLVDALALMAGVLIGVVALLLCVDVAVRYLQIINIVWIGEISTISLYLMTLLAAPWVLREGGHIAVESLTQSLPERVAARVGIVVNLIGAAICGTLCYYALNVLIDSYAAGTKVYKMLVYPQWYLFVLPPLAFALMSVLFVRRAGGSR